MANHYEATKVPHTFRRIGNQGGTFIELRREYRCSRCKVLCADLETLQIHERFCDTPHHPNFRKECTTLNLPDKMRKMLEKKQTL